MKKVSLLLMLIVLLSCRRNEPPTCIITHPSNNAVFTRGVSIPISVNADDPDGTILEVRLYFNNIGIAAMENFPFNFELNTDEYALGNYTLKATVTDNSGLEASDEIQITIDADFPSVTTSDISEIAASSANCGGDVVSDRGAAVKARGVCWSTSQSPTISDSYTSDGSGNGSFSSTLTGLNPYTTYHLRAYATNSVGTGYGEQVSFKTLWDNSTITDYDGNVYNTIQIGDQIWMVENLKVAHSSNGTAILLVESTSSWDALTETDKAYCWYNNSSSNGNTYGALYTWAAAMNGSESSDAKPSGVQGVCPSDWHLPSDAEWKQLEMYLGMSQAEANLEGYRGIDEGGKLKETGTTHWNSPNTGATNESGFTALPAGRRTNNGNFVNFTLHTELWTTSQNYSNDAWHHSLGYNHKQVYRGDHYKDVGLSVRCVKN